MALDNIIGNLGVALIVGSYLLVQMERVAPTGLGYSLTNAVGASFVLVSLAFAFNLSALLVESFWLVISLYGIAKHVSARRSVEKG